MFKQNDITKYFNIKQNKSFNKSVNKSNKSCTNISNNVHNKSLDNLSSILMNTSQHTSVDNQYYIYTDGACTNNGTKYAKAGLGIYFGDNDHRNISKRIQGKQSNNVAELTAIKDTFNIIKYDILSGKNITIISDSRYSILCVTSYGKKCSEKKWNINIPNLQLVKDTYELYKNIKNVHFQHIKAHTNKTDKHSIGNYNADKLATDSLK
jgi:ribonuclease HI